MMEHEDLIDHFRKKKHRSYALREQFETFGCVVSIGPIVESCSIKFHHLPPQKNAIRYEQKRMETVSFSVGLKCLVVFSVAEVNPQYLRFGPCQCDTKKIR